MILPPAAKVKAHLGKIKETILDAACVSFSDVHSALLLAEVLQRGVLLDTEGSSSSSKDESISAIIRSTAGKTMLQDGLPKPLLAAAAAMAGMLAEKCASFHEESNATATASAATENHPAHHHQPPCMAAALIRCKEVQDDRLTLLLCPSHPSRDGFNTMALGFYLRAASFQPESPVMWKRALDVLSSINTRCRSSCSLGTTNQIGGEHPHATVPLEQLIRIADSKGNAKRVSDLSLRLAEAWLETPSVEDEGPVYRAFCPFPQPSVPSQPLRVRVKKAQQALAHCDDLPSLVPTILSLRIALEQEAAMILDMAMEEQVSAKNRGTSLSLEMCQTSARIKVILGMTTEVDAAAEQLRTHVSSLLILTSDTCGHHEEQALSLLSNHIQRLQDRARNMGLASMTKKSMVTQAAAQEAWKAVGSFVLPILSMETAFIDVKSKARDLFLRALISSARIMWMTCGSGQGIDPALVQSQPMLQSLIEDCLCVLREQKQAEPKAVLLLEAQSTAQLSDMDKVLLDLECAHATVSSWVQPSSLTISDVLSEDSSRQAQFGCCVLHCLLAWSGFHQTPWPYAHVTQARAMIRRAMVALNKASSEWGREASPLELLLMNLVEADAEVGVLARVSQEKYNIVLEQLVSLKMPSMESLIRSHCWIGMARLAFQSSVDHAEAYAQNSLDEVERIGTDCIPYLWTGAASLEAAKAFHKSMSRQLVADSLIRASRPDEAESFLLAAVNDAPHDFDASFGLGAFRLRMLLSSKDKPTISAEKTAQTQLLRAAKLNSTQADPFSLLGIWYEWKGDETRAMGCYSKALLLDPAHPVAGRGILRMKSFSDVANVIDASTKATSSLNGWAWWVLGTNKAMIDNHDDLAAICFQEALRCRDIASPESVSLYCFFAKPNQPQVAELGGVWSALGNCYRRLGRYTAAVRAFTVGWEASGRTFPPHTLCSWAEVELELGLFDEAAEKYGMALEQAQHEPSTGSVVIAAFGQGRALLAMAQRDSQDGKAGAAYNRLILAIERIKSTLVTNQGEDETLQSDFGCALKLLGDLYTFGAGLPPAVFCGGDQATNNNASDLLRAQISFIAQGEAAYLAAQQAKSQTNANDDIYTKAAIQCDLGANILLQSQILSALYGEGQGGKNLSLVDVISSCSEVKKMFDRASDCFRAVIAECPLYAPAWCGLGCAVCGSDPFLAQHAFARCLQLDKTSPDGWSNLGFLYASHGQLRSSIEMMDHLTQVADTPLMWICRAALLEREALGLKRSDGASQRLISQAADAYRAALQVMKHPSALLGLSLSCRVSPFAMDSAKKQSFGSMREYEGLTSGCNQGAVLLRNLMTIEAICQKDVDDGLAWTGEVLRNEMTNMVGNADALEAAFFEVERTSTFVDSKNGGVDSTLVKDIVRSEQALEEPTDTNAQNDKPFNFQLSLSRQLLHDPEDGELWLELAKRQAKELISIQGVTKRRLVRQKVEAAVAAANKAVSVLVHQQVTSSDGGANSDKVAAALALCYWAGFVGNACLNAKEVKPVCLANAYDLQKAMMLCPDNLFAREAIKNVSEFT